MIYPTDNNDIRRILIRVLTTDDMVPCHAGLHMVKVSEVAVIDHHGAVCVSCAAEIDRLEFQNLPYPCDEFVSAGRGLIGDSEREHFCIQCGHEFGDHVDSYRGLFPMEV
jgi:hypothetical protein